ncbi:MAG: response regulator [Gammaproteobacteria bacterium]|nr:response regulator [Gammaproteobacteria bacterium]
MPTALVVDDEPLLTRHLCGLLARCWPKLQIVQTPGNGTEAIQALSRWQPDIAFLDIRMPGVCGLDVARHAGDTLIVFVTAYDAHALEAFERAAVDYLLKPVTEARLQETVNRLRPRLEAGEHRPAKFNFDPAALRALLTEIKPASHLRWLRVGHGDSVELINVSEAVYLRADRKYTAVFTAHHEHLLRTPLSQLEQDLDPDQFWRIHRSIIVNAGHIAEAVRDFAGRLQVRLRNRAELLPVSKTFAGRFRQM